MMRVIVPHLSDNLLQDNPCITIIVSLVKIFNATVSYSELADPLSD